MIEYILGMLFFLYAYRNVKIYRIKRTDFRKLKPIPGAEPFFHKKGKTGVLCIHGFTSSCYDYIELGNYLAKKNISVKAVLLPGHGTTPAHMITKTDIDWKREVSKGMNELRKHCNKVYICGNSLGGCLALWYASRKNVDGVISIGSPILIKREKIWKFIFPIVRRFKVYQKKWYHTMSLDEETIRKRVTYDRIPLKAGIYAAKVVKDCRKALPKVKAPLMIMQSTTDWGVGPGSVDYIYKKVKSMTKQVVWIKDAYHVVLVDKKKKEAFKYIYDFVKH